MKTLVVTLEYPPQVGGIANYIEEYMRYQLPDQVAVVAPRQKGDAESDARWPWRTYRVRPLSYFGWPRWLRLYFITKKIVAKEHASHLHVHHVLPVGYIAYRLKKIKRITGYTVFLHGTDVVRATEKKRKREWFVKIVKAADNIVVNSNYLKEKVLALAPDVSVTVVHPCPSEYFFEKISAEEKKAMRAQLAITNRPSFISVGRMVPGKGFARMVHLLSRVLIKVPDAVWVVVGNGPERNALLSEVRRAGLQNAVRFLGNISHDQLPRLYQSVDAFVLLTHPYQGAEESWGTVFLEAAASGLPVVAGKCGGVEEAVINNETGFVVPVDDDAAVVAAIVSALTDRTLAVSLGSEGEKRARLQFRWDQQIRTIPS